MQAIAVHLDGLAGTRGLGFGVGKEPLVAALAGDGAMILASDLPPDLSVAAGWAKEGQHSASLEGLQHPGLCDPEALRARVTFRAVNMNAIPDDLVDFDFLWSSCALEHLGSLAHGIKFVERAMRCLKPGGLAIHTTEFNVSSDEETFEHENLSVYRRRDLLGLAEALLAQGHSIPQINFFEGDDRLDLEADVPPYKPDAHVKLAIAGHRVTSFGMIIRKGEGSRSDGSREEAYSDAMERAT